MKTSLIALLGALAASLCAPASAQAIDSARLRAAASGPTVVVGHASFRLIPGAVVRVADAADVAAGTQSLQSTQTTAEAPVARFDRYSIYLESARTAARAARAQPPTTVVAALETHSGQLALLGASIKLFDTTPAVARALATRTGGALVYASAIDGSAMIRYDSVASALDNCTQLQGSTGVGAITPEVIPRAARPL
ncbi:hypothetical protein FHY30_003645 [Xanthomonas arboricola]|uniref:hypothetical protein n=1 Tax=Xanthomonas campestris TaxID=339 RepID=UPI0023E9E62B|nr:hypothetical protein [Xanthomonas campestris]